MKTRTSLPLIYPVAGLLLAGFGLMNMHAAALVYRAAILADNPIAYWEFDEGDGATIAADSSGNGNDGTYTGTVGFGAESFDSNLGSAIDLNGSNAYIDVPALGTFAQRTIEAWINIRGLAGGCCTSIYSTDTWATGNLHFNLKTGRDVEHAINAGGPNNQNTPGGAIQDGVWYHLVATYDTEAGGDTRIYIDGVEQLNGAHAAAPMNTLIAAQIGAWNATRFFNGFIDEVAIYDSILSPERVLAHFEAATAAGAGFRITDINYQPDIDELSLTWTSAPNRTYAIAFSPDLTTWIELDDGVPSAGMSTSFTELLPLKTPRRFYRVGENSG